MDDEVTMKINIVIKFFVATVMMIGIIYFLGIRLTPELALKAYEADADNFEPGIITMFDSNGNEVGCSIVY